MVESRMRQDAASGQETEPTGYENWPEPLGIAVCLDREPVNQRRSDVRRSD
jgi:hypothetical protein